MPVGVERHGLAASESTHRLLDGEIATPTAAADVTPATVDRQLPRSAAFLSRTTGF